MALFYGLVSGLVAIGVVWLIRKMLRQSYIDSLKDMLVLVGMASGAAWLIGRGFETSELIAADALTFEQLEEAFSNGVVMTVAAPATRCLLHDSPKSRISNVSLR